MRIELTEILVIGTPPPGSVAAGFLRQLNHQVLIIEKEQFPHIAIGKNSLSQRMKWR